MTTETKCPYYGNKQIIHIPDNEYDNWTSGVNIQDALVSLTENQREALLSEICGNCWELIFKTYPEQ